MPLCRSLALVATFGVLSACGDTAQEQALFGAGLGAGAAKILDGRVLLGAAAGAAANLLYCQENPSKC